MKFFYWLALIFVIIGAINWGVLGVVKIDLIALFFEKICFPLSRIIYCLIGLSGIFVIYSLSKIHFSPKE